MPSHDVEFAGSIPEVYDRCLVPMFFDPYGHDMAARIARRQPARVLEVAAGTGALTRALAATLPAGCAIVATDLNPPMLARAAAAGTARPVDWRAADGAALPFPDAAFDVVACQFGVMFFPDKAKAYGEARRVLRPGGLFVFNVWDRLDANVLADAVTRALADIFPADPPRFLDRTPHACHDLARIADDLRGAGFGAPPACATLALRSRAPSAALAARALCLGTPLRNEIEARAPGRLDDVAAQVGDALARALGPGPIDAAMQAHVVEVDRA